MVVYVCVLCDCVCTVWCRWFSSVRCGVVGSVQVPGIIVLSYLSLDATGTSTSSKFSQVRYIHVGGESLMRVCGSHPPLPSPIWEGCRADCCDVVQETMTRSHLGTATRSTELPLGQLNCHSTVPPFVLLTLPSLLQTVSIG